MLKPENHWSSPTHQQWKEHREGKAGLKWIQMKTVHLTRVFSVKVFKKRKKGGGGGKKGEQKKKHAKLNQTVKKPNHRQLCCFIAGFSHQIRMALEQSCSPLLFSFKV